MEVGWVCRGHSHADYEHAKIVHHARVPENWFVEECVWERLVVSACPPPRGRWRIARGRLWRLLALVRARFVLARQPRTSRPRIDARVSVLGVLVLLGGLLAQALVLALARRALP
jgi:hypothetical protein